jgi:hypothetical protein
VRGSTAEFVETVPNPISLHFLKFSLFIKIRLIWTEIMGIQGTFSAAESSWPAIKLLSPK